MKKLVFSLAVALFTIPAFSLPPEPLTPSIKNLMWACIDDVIRAHIHLTAQELHARDNASFYAALPETAKQLSAEGQSFCVREAISLLNKKALAGVNLSAKKRRTYLSVGPRAKL